MMKPRLFSSNSPTNFVKRFQFVISYVHIETVADYVLRLGLGHNKPILNCACKPLMETMKPHFWYGRSNK